MSNIYCAICNEPWDVYGLSHGDVKAWEADAIKTGYGCPCCIANGKTQTDKYKKPDPKVIGKCSYCKRDITIDRDDIWYDGAKIEYDEININRLANNEIVCSSCKESLVECDECGKYGDEEETVFLQDLNVCLCMDCYEQLVTNCPDCGGNYWNSDEHDCCCNSKEKE